MFSTLTLCTVAYILGIISSPVISLSSLLLFAACAAFVYLLGRRFFHTSRLEILIFITMFSIGGLAYSVSQNSGVYDKFPDKYVTLNGTVSSISSQASSEYKYRYTINANRITYLDKTYKINQRIIINSKTEPAFGDTVSVSGFLTSFSDSGNEFEFSYPLYYKSLDISCRLTALEFEITGKAPLYPNLWPGKIKYIIHKNIQSALSGDDLATVSAIALGDKSRFSKDYKTLLVKTGLLRVLYSPFIHLTLIFALCFRIFSARKHRDTAALILILLYIFSESTSPLALKSALVAGIIIFRREAFGFAYKIDIILLVVFAMTLYQPMLCFNGGFMMSVVTPVFLNISYKPIYRKLLSLRFPKSKRLKQLLTVWLILVFGTTPFTAYYFNGISVFSVLVTPLILPFIAAILVLVPFLFIFPGAYSLMAFLQPILLKAISVIKIFSYLVEKLPFYYVTLRTPSPVEILFFCLLWLILLKMLSGKLKTPDTAYIVSAALGLLVCILFDFGIHSLDIYFVNVGQGDAAVLHTKYGETVIIDGGGSTDYQKNYNIGESVFLPYLISHGFTNIDVAVLSHYHKDHAEGIIAAAENLKINTLILPDTMPDNSNRQKLEEIAKRKHIKIEYLHQGDMIKFRSGLKFTVEAPDNIQLNSKNENNSSFVLLAEYGDFTALFTGDFEDEETLPSLKADILKVSHHGSENGSCDEFIHNVSPKFSVISVGKRNTYGLPDVSVIEKLQREGSQVLRTDFYGDIRFKISKNGNITYSSFFGGN